MDEKQFDEVVGLPVFTSGFHNGATYTDQDLDDIVSAWKATKDVFRRPLRFTHNDPKHDVGKSLALGEFTNMYIDNVDGKKFVKADLTNVPKGVKKAVQDGRILDRSIELYRKFDWDGNAHKLTLRGMNLSPRAKEMVPQALALLGDEIPGVKGMPKITDYFQDDEPEYITVEFNESEKEYLLRRCDDLGREIVKNHNEKIIEYLEAADKSDGDSDKAAAIEVDGDETKPASHGAEQTQITTEVTMTDQIKPFRSFADEKEFNEFITAKVNEAVTPTQAENQDLKKRLTETNRAQFDKSVELAFSELGKPNESGLAIPPAALDPVKDWMKTQFCEDTADVLAFGEKGKELSALDVFKTSIETILKAGLVNFKETLESDENSNDTSEVKKLTKEFTEMKDAGWFTSGDMTVEKFIEANRKRG